MSPDAFDFELGVKVCEASAAISSPTAGPNTFIISLRATVRRMMAAARA
jgi:hypothetical protein